MHTPHEPSSSQPQPPASSDSLERFIDKALRDQPLQRAPRDLESKVMAAIAHRATAPWWQSSFRHWPVAARMLFLVASVGFVRLVLEATTLIIDPLNPSARGAALVAELSWIHGLFATIGGALSSLPSWWIYCGLTALGTLYLMLFGASAAAYRTLYASR
jgi:hypothetical protein